MNKSTGISKSNYLFTFLSLLFVTCVIIAEIVGVKIFSLEKWFGILPMKMNLFGIENISLSFTAGVIIWPVVFLLTDIINEYFGIKGVRFISITTAIMTLLAFGIISIAIKVPAVNWWKSTELADGIIFNQDLAFTQIFGQSQWIIIGSITAFLIGQLFDAYIFRELKQLLNGKNIWLRATLSTLISQLIDSFVVLFIAFYLGADWSFQLVMAICIVNYVFKAISALVLSPLLYVAHHLIDTYLGPEISNDLKRMQS